MLCLKHPRVWKSASHVPQEADISPCSWYTAGKATLALPLALLHALSTGTQGHAALAQPAPLCPSSSI